LPPSRPPSRSRRPSTPPDGFHRPPRVWKCPSHCPIMSGTGEEGTMIHVAYTLGRICVPIVFLVTGVKHFLDIAGFAKYMADNNVPLPDTVAAYLGGIPKFEALAYLCAAIEVICGLMILIGLKARWAALLLIVFTACTIAFIHHFWDMEG